MRKSGGSCGRAPGGISLRLSLLSLLLLALAAGLYGCDSAFAPPADGDLDAEGEWEQDGEDESDATEGDGDPDGATEYNLVLDPQFAYQGDSFSGGSIHFRQDYEDVVRARLAEGDPSFQSWEVNYGKDIDFQVVRFDPDTLRFYDMQAVVSARARTGERIVRVRITYGEVSVIEYGRFYVLPPVEGQAFGGLN